MIPPFVQSPLHNSSNAFSEDVKSLYLVTTQGWTGLAWQGAGEGSSPPFLFSMELSSIERNIFAIL